MIGCIRRHSFTFDFHPFVGMSVIKILMLMNRIIMKKTKALEKSNPTSIDTQLIQNISI